MAGEVLSVASQFRREVQIDETNRGRGLFRGGRFCRGLLTVAVKKKGIDSGYTSCVECKLLCAFADQKVLCCQRVG